MSTTIKADVSRMFAGIAPCLVSGSAFELGQDAARITWTNAMAIAARRAEWLLGDVFEAAEAMRYWAVSTGAWDRAEVSAWPVQDCLALFAQNVAADLRAMGCHDSDGLTEVAAEYESNHMDENSSLTAYYYDHTPEHGCETRLNVDYYTGV